MPLLAWLEGLCLGGATLDQQRAPEEGSGLGRVVAEAAGAEPVVGGAEHALGRDGSP